METTTTHHKTLSRVKWQWKSNSDPWSEVEKPQWTSYSLEQTYLIENAYHEKQKEVDLEEYVVSLRDLIQKKKGNITRQRSIRRIDCEDDEMDDRSERYFETELPKTINNVFGSLGHFIGFFSKRNPEILDLTEQFEGFEQINDLDGLNKKICPQLICCFEEELLKPIRSQLNDCTISEYQKKIKIKAKSGYEELISLFQKELGSFEEFYGLILRSYTMNTDLYLNLNKYLRNESWTAIDNLLPYVICLCKAFFSLKLSANLQKEKKSQEAENSMVLYRGTALDELALGSYQAEKAFQLFSWNSVTSSSTNRQMAENFMYLNSDIENKRYPVLFIIEIPITNESEESEYLKWIDIHQYSAKPAEDEVILPPGSVFEVQQVSTDQDKRTIINLKLKHNVEFLAHQGLIMQGAFHTEMMGGNQVKIMCLRGEELDETLKNLAGNRLIEGIEFCLCRFNNRSLEEMFHLLPTLTKTKRLKFICCHYEDEQGISSLKLKNVKKCSILKVEIIESHDFYRIFSIMKDGDEFWASLRKLKINFRNVELEDFILHGWRHLSQLESLKLYFHDNREITDEGVNNLAFQGLNYLTKVSSLILDFSPDDGKEKSVQNLASSRLKYRREFDALVIHFKHSQWITEKGVVNLASQKLRYCATLTSLTLDFSHSEKINDSRMDNLASEGLKYLTQLTCLIMNFKNCERITDIGVGSLAQQGLKYLNKLRSLTLSFSACTSITGKGIEMLASQGLHYLTQLTSLILDFSACYRITENGINILTSHKHELKSLTQLTSLTLDFSSPNWLSRTMSRSPDEPNNLEFQGLTYPTQLTSLTLNFGNSIRITDEKIRLLTSQGLQHLTKLTTFTLRFHKNTQITYEGLDNLTNQGLNYLTELACLTLFLPNLGSKSEEMSRQEFQGLEKLTQLKSFTLDFQTVSKITDEGIINLTYKGLQHYTKLTSLTLNLSNCKGITDEGVNYVANQGLKHLTNLILLTLNFSQCDQITDEGLKSLGNQGLKYLIKLDSLTLDFLCCDQITEAGLNNLVNQGLQYLIQLTCLTLSFGRPYLKTHDIFSNLTPQIFKNLSKLKTLILNSEIQRFNNPRQVKENQEENPPKSFSMKFTRRRSLNEIPNQQAITLLPENSNSHLLPGASKLFRQSEDSFRKILLSIINPTPIRSDNENFYPDLINTPFIIFSQTFHLSSFTLNLEEPSKITDEIVSQLTSQGLKYLTQLTSLTLNFSSCLKVTNQAVNDLSQALKDFTKLTSLTLNFSWCRQITNAGVENLASQALQFLTQLTSVTLHFSGCFRITDEGINSLTSQGIKSLSKLASLSLYFSSCDGITNKGIDCLASQGLKYLSKLVSLTLRFSGCSRVTDEGMNSLASQGLKHLCKLTSLTLYFSGFDEITNEGIHYLAYQGLKPLTCLTSLNLHFNHCPKISDEGVNNLISDGIKYLNNLTSLILDLVGCSLTEFTVCNMIRVLHYFGYLLE